LGFVGSVLSSILHQKDKVLMSSVTSLTFYNDRWTTGRRNSPIRQMSCQSGPCKAAPDVIQCVVTGRDGKDPQWKCDSTLPTNVELGKVEISCEGYDYPDDPYILHGSCGLEYALRYTAGDGQAYSTYHSSYESSPSYSGGGSSWFSELVAFSLFVGIFYLVFRNCLGQTGAGPSAAYHSPSASYAPSPPGPGFWSGLGLGALFGWRPSWGGGWGGGWGGNYGGNYGRYGGGYSGYRAPSYSRPSYSSSSGSSFSSSGSRTSSSFGGTKRR